MSTKYYKTLKETPMWEAGAIISNENNSTQYTPIDNIFERIDGTDGYYEAKLIIESPDNKDWFERVYKVNLLTKVVYETKQKAKELIANNFK